MALERLMRIDRSFPLPGLGLLALPPQRMAALHQLPLHSALEVVLRQPGQQDLRLTATVEEVQYGAEPEPTLYGLLLETTTLIELSAAAELWWQLPV